MKETKSKVLVIDDEAAIREGCERVLSKEGWEVLLASDGYEGLRLAEASRGEVEVVLLDLKMPGISGMEVLEKLLTVDPRVPVIVITGYATVDAAVEAMKKGAYDFIPKPFTSDQLRLVVQRAAEKYRLEQEAERLRLEAARTLRDVAREKGRLFTVIECMADGVLVTDDQGRIALFNPAASRLLDLGQKGEVLGRSLEEVIVSEELRIAVQEALVERGYKVFTQEFRLKDRLIRAHTAPVKGEDGSNMGTVTVLEDLSYLLELDRMKGEFIAMVSHELRSPVAAIDQIIGAVLLKESLEEKDRRLLERARERAKGLIELVNKLLELSRIEAGMAIQRRELIQVEEVVQRVVELMTPQALTKGLELKLELKTSLPPILGDPQGLEGVFTNLLSNAIKYTPQGGRITVTMDLEGEYVKVSVSDTGIGIPKEELPRIFDKFYRIRTAQTREAIGTGLGLAIVKGIVEAHLGRIEVQSEPGVGSTFSVYLPRSRVDLSYGISRS